jgi:uncharacterized protein
MHLAGAHLKLDELVVSAFRSLSGYALGHPKRVLVIFALITLAVAPGVGRLKLRTDGQALVPQKAPAVLYDQAIRQQFGIDDNIVVVVHASGAEGIFNPATVQLVRELTAELARLPGLGFSNLMSLATEPGFRFRPGTLVLQTLLEPPLATKAELGQLRADLRKIELYTGTLVSSNGQSTAILIAVPRGGDRTRLYGAVVDTIEAKRRQRAAQASRRVPGRLALDANAGETPALTGDTPVLPAPDEIKVTGAPVAESLLGIHILEDLGVPSALLGTSSRLGTEQVDWRMPASFYELRLLIARRIGLVPVAVLVMMLVFLVSFRNALAMLLPLPGVLATMVFVFGLMGWLGVPVYLTTAVMPVLLTATGVTNDIYLFNRYFTLLREKGGGSHVELLFETFDKMVSPVASTSLTTAAGFLSFGFSPLGPVRAFGVCTGVGVLFGLFCSLTVVPALLALINPARLISNRRRPEPRGPTALAAWFGRLGPAVVRWRWCVAGLVLLVIALTPLGLRRLVVQDSWTGGFDPHSEFSQATRLVNDEFYGMHLLFVSCDAPQLFTGEIPGSALTVGRVVLPGELVPEAAFLPGSSFSIFPAGTNAGQPSPITHALAPTIWQTRIQKAVRGGKSLMVYTARWAADSAACQALSGTDRLRFQIVRQTQFDPQIIQAIDELGGFIRARAQYGVGGVLDPADYLRTTRFMLRPENPAAKVLPGSATEAKFLWDYYRFARGPRRLRQAVDANYSQSLTTVFLKDANFVDTAKLMSDLRAYERDHLAPRGITLGFAGDVALSQALIKGVVTTQLQSLFWSVAGICLITAILGGSLRWGVYCVVPSALAVVIKFAIMGWLGIPLGVATSMFAAMTLGIGVNCAIQLLESYGQARAGGAPSLEAANRAMALTGPPALVNTIAVSLGFGVLMLSQVPANARLGLLVVVGLVNCFVMSLLLLPVLLHWWPLKGPRESGHRSGSRT